MSWDRQRELRRLEGQAVSVTLRDGSHLDGVVLVSASRHSVWLTAHDEDTFLPVDDVVSVRSAAAIPAAA